MIEVCWAKKCTESATNRCSHCQQAYYCCVECQRAHYHLHRQDCEKLRMMPLSMHYYRQYLLAHPSVCCLLDDTRRGTYDDGKMLVFGLSWDVDGKLRAFVAVRTREETEMYAQWKEMCETSHDGLVFVAARLPTQRSMAVPVNIRVPVPKIAMQDERDAMVRLQHVFGRVTDTHGCVPCWIDMSEQVQPDGRWARMMKLNPVQLEQEAAALEPASSGDV